MIAEALENGKKLRELASNQTSDLAIAVAWFVIDESFQPNHAVKGFSGEEPRRDTSSRSSTNAPP